MCTRTSDLSDKYIVVRETMKSMHENSMKIK